MAHDLRSAPHTHRRGASSCCCRTSPVLGTPHPQAGRQFLLLSHLYSRTDSASLSAIRRQLLPPWATPAQVLNSMLCVFGSVLACKCCIILYCASTRHDEGCTHALLATLVTLLAAAAALLVQCLRLQQWWHCWHGASTNRGCLCVSGLHPHSPPTWACSPDPQTTANHR